MKTGPILVTGSRGFLASHLAARLKRDYPGARLELVDHKPQPGHAVCDLLDPRAVAALLRRVRPALIFHLAGTTRPLDWQGLWSAHVEATVRLLDAVRAAKLTATNLWCIGSAAEYGDTSKRKPATEDTAPQPLSAYGSTKLSQTLAALSYRHQGIKVSVARVFNVSGPGMPAHLSLSSFAKQISQIEHGLQEPSLRVGNLAPRRDYVDARDVARALSLLACLPSPAPLYNVCSGRLHPISVLLKTLLASSERKIELVQDPVRWRKADARECRGSHALLTKHTGWRPEISLRQSLADTLDWYRSP